MKTILNPIPKFSPVSITLVFESQRELDIIGSIFNTSCVSDSIREMGGTVPDTNLFVEAGGNIHLATAFYDEIKTHLTY